ncbi:MAG: DUF2059 domain-containing protein [Desulfobacterales bacterium]|jgi:hypothetical protein|nr:DUF2059 domain-containing protein [Desulfobacterales bacterium]
MNARNGRTTVLGTLAGLLLASVTGLCAAADLSDDQWRQAMLGTWVQAYAMAVEQVEFNADGTYTSTSVVPLPERDLELRARATWAVADGHLLLTLTEADPPGILKTGEQRRIRLLATDGRRMTSIDEKGAEALFCRPLEAEHRRVIETLIDTIEARQIQALLESQLQQTAKQLRGLAYPTKSEENDAILVERVTAFLRKASQVERFRSYHIHLYGSIFSKAEIQALVDFYGTEIGRAIKDKMPEMLERTQRDTAARMQYMVPAIQAIIENTLKALPGKAGA